MALPDPDYILNRWACIPEPEQALLRVFGEYTQVAFGIISFSQVVVLLSQFGAQPAEKRAEVIWTKYHLPVSPENPFSCFDPEGCIRPAAVPVLNALWAGMLTGGYPVGAPDALPCRSRITKP